MPSMPPRDNHYTRLELDVTASTAQIRLGLDRLSRQADARAYTSPAEARVLWRHIRQIRKDLLSGREAREAYDLALLSDLRSEELSELVGMPVVFPFPPSAAVAQTEIDERKKSDPVVRWAPLVGVAAVLLVLMLALLPLGEGSKQEGIVASTGLLLTNSGPRVGSGYVSGQVVTLLWSAPSGARLYRLQIAATPTDPSDRVVFRRPLRTVVTHYTSYSMRVVGAQLYYWRVQALAKGRWTAYTHSRHFLVDRPTIESPIALGGSSPPHVRTQRVRVCWSQVHGTVGYRLQIMGYETVTVQGKCASLRLYPGIYRWRVAGLVRGARVYTGKASPVQLLTVGAPQTVRLVALRTPARPAATSKRATPVSYGQQANSRKQVRRIRRAIPIRQPETTRSPQARIVATRVSTAQSSTSTSTSMRQVARKPRFLGRHRAATSSRSTPARSSIGRPRSRHQTKQQQAPAHSAHPVAPVPPPPAPPAVPASANPAPVSSAPTSVAPPAVVLQTPPATGASVYVSPPSSRARSVAAPVSGARATSAPLVSTPSHAGQPVAAAPTARPAAGSHPVSPAPPPTASAPTGPTTGSAANEAPGNNQGRGADHGNGEGHGDRNNPGNQGDRGDQSDRGDQGNHGGSSRAGHPSHP